MRGPRRAAASRGLRVTGLDGAPSAVEQARTRAPGVTFAVADATELEGYEGRFDTVAAMTGLDTDADGRVLVPVWQLKAVRS
ncbi:class I SAM-dependent methyltransferase [Amycolatopsis sp. A133]|uniref:class I SAM-dependent methyltransferase n=1 Tax=Amycolatopsis sp. A133 TaxID=3064472 RepID=UPI0027F364DA|nr:class I SAM-dependent methyltransferase [Amycolatopsis sp. A133]MDQ7802224.1 class I SAM-dependent methyltransferase [Amycolatopsis sp. A133]